MRVRSPFEFGLAIVVALWLAPVVAGAANPGVSGIDFDRDIRPILSDNCFACHGPDEQARKAGLRLDVKEEAVKPMKGGRFALVPGDPAASQLLTRVLTTDEDDVMPPPSTHKKLDDSQKERLERWIAAGAPWQGHWAFDPPRRPPVPSPKNARWAHNDIDRFVAARLDQEGLKPSPEAPKTTLIRRATLDVTGLPPTVEEVDAFLADKNPEAYERLVDRLLESPRYGEHQARYWLDSARYADSHGYHIDSQRDIWAYRDWVIRAFNTNQPFNQFTVEQLAGDLLPEATPDQKIATGYIRSNMSTGEGGAIEAEYAAKYAFDRTETTGTMWLGLTMTCARCHTHKYDPITHREYYSLLSFFNQLDEPVMDGNKPNPDPFLKLPSAQQTERLAWLARQSSEGETKVKAPHVALDPAQSTWASQWHERLRSGWSAAVPESAQSAKGAQLRTLDDGSVLVEGPNPETDVLELTFRPEAGRLGALRLTPLTHASLPKQGAGRAEDGSFRLSEIEAEVVVKDPEGKAREPRKLKLDRAMAARAEADLEVGKAIDGRAETAWSASVGADEPAWSVFLLDEPADLPEQAELRVRLRFEKDKERHTLGRFRIELAQGEELLARLHPPRPGPWKLIGPFKTDGLQAGFATEFPPEKELDLAKSYPGVREDVKWHDRADLGDGPTHLLVNDLHGIHGAYYLHRMIKVAAPARLEISLRADDLFKLWVNDELAVQRDDAEAERGVASRTVVDLKPGENRLLLKVVNHQGAKYFSFNAGLAGAETVSPEVAAILSSIAQPVGVAGEMVRDYFRRQNSGEFREMFDNLAGWREEKTAIEAAIPTTLVAKELEKPRETRILLRGEYDQPGEVVTAGVPAVLPPLPAGAPTNRLGLAQWLVDPVNPLTARVIANRFWQQHFGIGLVKTSEDFGAQGERPSHPELLDWLATELVRIEWNLKQLHRLMLTSATYRQSSGVTPALFERDPENRLLARGPRFRVDAEVLRDTALYVSGLLVEQRGGPSVKPYEPPGLWEAVSFNNSQKYVPDRGDAQYRRSLYTFWKRQSPPPNMLILDASTREYCVVRRPRTNTPLQALALLNDPQWVEASRAFAQRVLLEGGGTLDSRLAYAFRLVAARPPDRDELGVLRNLWEQQLAEFRQNPDDAGLLLGVGDFKAKDGIDPAELAAWATITSLLLNLDEAVTKG